VEASLIDAEKVDVNEFRRVLTETPGERAITKYLKSAPWIPYWTFCTLSGHDRYAIYEFPLGSTFKADMLLLNSYSGAWEAWFIEFESADDSVFTKAGVPTQTLASAQRQIDDWRQYIDRHKELVRADMVRAAKKRDKLLYSECGEDPCNFSGNHLADPNSFIHWRFRIVIGRSSTMSSEERSLLGRYPTGHGVEIVTYDRLLRLAEARYERKHLDSAWFNNNVA
jgi:hypothetical protein